MIFELARDYADALAAMPREHPKRRTLELFEEAIRRDIHFIDRHPTTLFQCMWNLCWWYDCPDAADYYALGENCATAPPWSTPGTRLSHLIEAWHDDKQRHAPGFNWVRCLRPPQVPLDSSLRLVLGGHDAPVASVAFSPDGNHVATASGKTIRIWHAQSGELLRSFRDSARHIAFSPRTGHLAGISFHELRIRDIETGQILTNVQMSGCLFQHLSFSTDGTRILTLMDNGDAIIRGPSGDEESRPIRVAHGKIISASLNSDATRVATIGEDSILRIWNVATGEVVRDLRLTERPHQVAFAPTRNLMAVSFWHKEIEIRDAQTLDLVTTLEGTAGFPNDMTFSSDGLRLSTCDITGNVLILDAITGKCLDELFGVMFSIARLCWSPVTMTLAVSADTTVRIWDDIDATKRKAVIRDRHRIIDPQIALSPNSGQLAIGLFDCTIRLWDMSCCKETGCLIGHEGPVNHVAYSPAGRYLLSASEDRTVRMWDVDSGAQLHLLRGHASRVHHTAFSSDAARIASASPDGTVRIWNTATGDEVRCITGLNETPYFVAFSPDGSRLAAFAYNDMRIWNTQTFEEMHRLDGMTSIRAPAIFSPDGRFIVSYECGTVNVIDPTSGSRLIETREEIGNVDDGCISGNRDGGILYQWADRLLRIWIRDDPRCFVVYTGICEPLSQVGEILAGDLTELPSRLPYIAMHEAEIRSFPAGESVAWLPLYANQSCCFVPPHTARVWIAYSGNHVQVFRFEGSEPVRKFYGRWNRSCPRQHVEYMRTLAARIEGPRTDHQ